MLRKLLRRARGVTAVEYALLVFMIAFAAIGVIYATGSGIRDVMCDAGTAIDAGGTPCTPTEPTTPPGPVTLSAYGYSVDCDARSASCRHAWSDGSGVQSEAAGEADCAAAPDAQQSALLQQIGLLAGGSDAASLVAQQCPPAGGGPVLAWLHSCSAGFGCVALDRQTGAQSDATDEHCAAYSAQAGDAALISAQAGSLPAGQSLMAVADRAGFDDGAACGDELTAFGWYVDCTVPQATCIGYSNLYGSDWSVPPSACGQEATPAQLAVLQASMWLLPPGPGQTPETVLNYCSAEDMAYGWSTSCWNGSASAWCEGVPRSFPSAQVDVDGRLCSDYVPQDGDDTLLAAAYLTANADLPAFYASCQGPQDPNTVFAWDFSCDSGFTCMEYDDRGFPLGYEVDAGNCSGYVPQPEDAAFLADTAQPLSDGHELMSVTDRPGFDATAACTLPGTAIYGWLPTCSDGGGFPDFPPIGIVAMEEGGYGNFTCYKTSAENPSQTIFVSDSAHCRNYRPDAAQQQALTQAGLLSELERQNYGDACGDEHDPVPDFGYGYRLYCSSASSSAQCYRVARDGGQLSAADAGSCASAQSEAGMTLARDAGLMPGYNGLTLNNAVQQCDSVQADYVFGWQVDCAGGSSSCQAIRRDYTDGMQEFYPSDTYQCNATNPPASDIAVLHAHDLLSNDEMSRFDYASCSVTGQPQAKWMMVLDGAPACDGSTLRQTVGRWACVRNGEELTGVDEAACPASDRPLAPFSAAVGHCTEGYPDLGPRNYVCMHTGGYTESSIHITTYTEGASDSQHAGPQTVQDAIDYCNSMQADCCEIAKFYDSVDNYTIAWAWKGSMTTDIATYDQAYFYSASMHEVYVTDYDSDFDWSDVFTPATTPH